MRSGYTPSSRQSNLVTSPIAGPSISPTSTYPPEIYAPRRQNRKSLSKVVEMDDTPSSSTSASTTGAQLVARDYALQSGSGNTQKDEVESETEEDSVKAMSPRRLDSPIEEHVGEFIPPESIHDKYLSKYIQPLGPTERPAPLRSTSTPGGSIPISHPMGSKASAIPLRGLGFTEVKEKEKGKEGHRPIFEIFNAELSEGSEGMVKALKGHLESVLRVQKEIGRMHLSLEGLGEGGEKVRRESEGKETEVDPLMKREKEVDGLMGQLSVLSTNLRTYHELGTPTLQFSHSNNTQPFSPTTPNPPALQRQNSAQPDILTTSPTPISPSPPRADVPRSLPTRHPMAVHKGIDNLKRQEGGPSRRSTHHQDLRQSSDLSPLKLTEEYAYDMKVQSPSASFWDLDALTRERDREKGVDNWMEHGIPPDEPRRVSGSVIGSLRSNGKGKKGFDSPIEMVDRTRPW